VHLFLLEWSLDCEGDLHFSKICEWLNLITLMGITAPLATNSTPDTITDCLWSSIWIWAYACLIEGKGFKQRTSLQTWSYWSSSSLRKYILAPPVEWSCSFVCHLHISLNLVDENRSLTTNPIDYCNIFLWFACLFHLKYTMSKLIYLWGIIPSKYVVEAESHTCLAIG
jgi:hypothetical protein